MADSDLIVPPIPQDSPVPKAPKLSWADFTTTQTYKGLGPDARDALKQKWILNYGQALVEKAATDVGVHPPLLDAMMQVESSGGKNMGYSPKGAWGPLQLLPVAAAEVGEDRMDPERNIYGGAKYLLKMLDMFGNSPARALAAYKRGIYNRFHIVSEDF